MNDPLDFIYAKNKLYPQMMEVANELSKEKVIPDYARQEVITNPFVVCFSKKEDDFLMWRMYNAKVALVLDKRFFEKPMPNTALIECEYIEEKSDLHGSFLKIAEQISNCMNISADVQRITTFIKHNSFETEGEVRLATWEYYNSNSDRISLPDCIDNDEIVEQSVCNRINKDGKIVLFKKFNIEKNALVGIIVHSYSQLEFDSIKEALRSILINQSYSREVFENIIPTNAYPFNL
jgi:hypothetical protein